MPEVDGQEKTEQATPKKLSDSRDEGQVAKSTEISSFSVFTIGILSLFIFQKFFGSQISEFTSEIFKTLDTMSLTKDVVQIYFIKWLSFFFITMSPVLLSIVTIALIVNIAQVGLKFKTKALRPKLSKFNLLKGIKNLFFTSRSINELAKSLLKLALVGGITYSIIEDFVMDSAKLVHYSIYDVLEFMLDAASGLVWKTGLIFAVLAAVDFIFQKYKFKKDMMMTKQEIKEEVKQAEGDPFMKGKIKSKQYAMARKRMMKDVPKADVVITNPTHYAIALKYEPEKGSSPIVLAKGINEVAQRIKKIAVENNIELYEDRELARSLYKMCEVGAEIPETLYHAVAKVLAYIYNLKNQKKTKRLIV